MESRKSFTITLNADLMREAKKRAIDMGVPLYMFVESAIHEALAAHSEPSPPIQWEDGTQDETGTGKR